MTGGHTKRGNRKAQEQAASPAADEKVWVKKGARRSGGGAPNQAETQVYSRNLLLKVMESKAKEEQRCRTPSTTATEASECSFPSPSMKAHEGGEELPPIITLMPALETDTSRKVGSTQSSGGSASMHAGAPEFVPGWVQEGIVFEAACAAAAVAMPASNAALHFAAVEAAERAAAKARATRFPAAARPQDVEAKKQIEYYFSLRNISHDFYLRSLMDEEGWVSLEEITNFPKIQRLGVDAAAAANVLRSSTTVQLSKDAKKVRITSSVLRQAFPKASADAHNADETVIVVEEDAEENAE